MTTEEPAYDKVTEASLNGIYVKAKEMDRGHSEWAAPDAPPPGSTVDVEAHASTCASGAADAEARASGAAAQTDDAQTRASDGETHASD